MKKEKKVKVISVLVKIIFVLTIAFVIANGFTKKTVRDERTNSEYSYWTFYNHKISK